MGGELAGAGTWSTHFGGTGGGAGGGAPRRRTVVEHGLGLCSLRKLAKALHSRESLLQLATEALKCGRVT
jgi:hypothetical protein